MGWKNVRDHYGIKGVISYDGKALYIGSIYVTQTTAVAPDGRIIKCDYRRGTMERHVDDIERDPAMFASLLASPDSFERSIAVYTYSDDQIIETFCEEFGFPNTTHDGELMFENSHFLDRADAVRQARAVLEARIVSCDEHMSDLNGQLAALKARRDGADEMLSGLIAREALAE